MDEVFVINWFTLGIFATNQRLNQLVCIFGLSYITYLSRRMFANILRLSRHRFVFKSITKFHQIRMEFDTKHWLCKNHIILNVPKIDDIESSKSNKIQSSIISMYREKSDYRWFFSNSWPNTFNNQRIPLIFWHKIPSHKLFLWTLLKEVLLFMK